MKKHLLLLLLANCFAVAGHAFVEGSDTFGFGTITDMAPGQYYVYYTDADGVDRFLYADEANNWVVTLDPKTIDLTSREVHDDYARYASFMNSNGYYMSNTQNIDGSGFIKTEAVDGSHGLSKRNWESQVFYKKDDKYAIRITNVDATSWGANCFAYVGEGTGYQVSAAQPSLGDILYIWSVVDADSYGLNKDVDALIAQANAFIAANPTIQCDVLTALQEQISNPTDAETLYAALVAFEQYCEYANLLSKLISTMGDTELFIEATSVASNVLNDPHSTAEDLSLAYENYQQEIGTYDGNIVWKYDQGTNTLTLHGAGDGTMNDYNSTDNKAPWNAYAEQIQTVIVNEGVTSIGNYAFYKYNALTSITLPEGVTRIGDYAFQFCESLASITLPESLLSIGNGSLSHCSSLTSITIPKGMTSIGDGAFDWSESLANIFVDANNANYDSRNGCNAIIETASNKLIAGCKNTVIPTDVTIIQSKAFLGCTNLASITIPESVADIGYYAFQYCESLTNITLPNSMPCIGWGLLSHCASLTDITIPENVTEIQCYAFDNCSSLTSIVIPDGVTSIGNQAFYDCSNLTSVTMKASTPCAFYTNTYTAVGDGVYNIFPSSNEGFKIYVPYGSGETYKSAEGWSNYANWIVELEPEETPVEPISGVDGNITWSLDTSTGVLTLSGEGSINDYGLELKGITTAPWGTYHADIKEVVIQSGVTSIGDCAFYGCNSLTSVTIPEGVTSIGNHAFDGCRSLASVTIPSSVTSLGSNAFYAVSLKEVHITGNSVPTFTPSQIGATSAIIFVPSGMYEAYAADENWGAYNKQIISADMLELRTVEVTAKVGVSAIDEQIGEANRLYVANLKVKGTINDYDLFAIRSKYIHLRDLDLSEASLVPAGDGFEYYTGKRLTEADQLGDCAFRDLNILRSVTLPATLKSIGNDAFSGCSRLETMELPDGVTTMGNYAFRDCFSLQSIDFGLSLQAVPGAAFYYCKGITSITLPASVTSIGNEAFRYCSKLASAVLPPRLESIGREAFSGCSSLTELRIPSAVQTIGDGAFSSCPLKDVYTYIVEPQQINQNTFSVYTTAMLHVPSTSWALYDYNTQWGQFVNKTYFDEPYEYFYIDNDTRWTTTRAASTATRTRS